MGVGWERNGVEVQGDSWKASNCNSKEKKDKDGWSLWKIWVEGSSCQRLKLQQQERKIKILTTVYKCCNELGKMKSPLLKVQMWCWSIKWS